MTRNKVLASVAVLGVALLTTACGSSSSSSSSASIPAVSTGSTPSSSGTSASATSSVTSGPVHATLTADSHTPKVGKVFNYTVHAADASGRPLSGTVDTEFAFGGQVVGHDVPPRHALKDGVLHDNITFPSAAIGYPISLQTVVHTKAGSVTLDWSVTVSK